MLELLPELFSQQSVLGDDFLVSGILDQLHDVELSVQSFFGDVVQFLELLSLRPDEGRKETT